MNKNTYKRLHKNIRKNRTRSKLNGTAKVPRVSIFKSNDKVNVQFVDDQLRKTLLSGNTSAIKKGNKTEKAQTLGEALAVEAKKAGIEQAIFDKGSSKYHGRVKAVAEGLRKGGIKF